MSVAFEIAQRRALDRFELDAESRFVDVAAIRGRAHVLVVGHGPPIAMLNGIGCPAVMWAPLIARLTGYRILAIDRPGCGLTSPAAPTTTTVRAHAVDFLVQTLDALALDRVPLVASSMGSLWSTWLALDRPERVSALAHVGTPALAPGTSAPWPMRLMSVPPIGRLLGRLQPPSLARMNRTAKMVNVDLERQPEVRAAMVASEANEGAEASFLALLEACVRLRGARPEVALTETQLERVGQPVQLVWGDADPFGDLTVAERVAACLPDARLDVVPGGHAPWIERPEQVAALLLRFLDEQPRER